MSLLRLDALNKAFGNLVVTKNVDLAVNEGELHALIGPNGAGKTTLLRAIFGVLEPDGGEVRWRGQPASTQDRRSWGYMPQFAEVVIDPAAAPGPAPAPAPTDATRVPPTET